MTVLRSVKKRKTFLRDTKFKKKRGFRFEKIRKIIKMVKTNSFLRNLIILKYEKNVNILNYKFFVYVYRVSVSGGFDIFAMK